MNTLQEKIDLMRAADAGETIQCRMTDDSDWENVSNPLWAWDNFEYRVKPKGQGKRRMSTLQEKIAVMQAAEAGKEIEWSIKHKAIWRLATGPCWDWLNYDFRVKPREPRKFYVNEIDGNLSINHHETESDAKEATMARNARVINFIEVLDE